MNTQQIERVDSPAFAVENLPAMMSITPMAMLGQAVANNAGVEVIEKLMALQERWEKNQARKAFDEAMALAMAEIPVVGKNKRVFFESKDKDKRATDYWYEDLGEIARTVKAILGRHGLTYRWRPTSTPNQPISVTCIISHRLGHFEESTLHAGADNSGNKNSIQAIGSTVTFLQRYTLKAALGLAAAKDDDGRTADGPKQEQEERPKPKPPNPNAPAPTGPRLLPINGRTAAAWADALWAEIQKATTTDEVKKWTAANEEILENLDENVPDIAVSLQNDIANHIAKLVKPSGPRPPNPNASAPYDPGEIPAGVDRRPKPTLKEQLLTSVMAISTKADAMRFADDKDLYERKKQLSEDDRIAVEVAYSNKFRELVGR